MAGRCTDPGCRGPVNTECQRQPMIGRQMGCDVGAGVGAGVGCGVGAGDGAGVAAGDGVGSGSGAGVRTGDGVGVGTGVAVGSGSGVGVGSASGVGGGAVPGGREPAGDDAPGTGGVGCPAPGVAPGPPPPPGLPGPLIGAGDPPGAKGSFGSLTPGPDGRPGTTDAPEMGAGIAEATAALDPVSADPVSAWPAGDAVERRTPAPPSGSPNKAPPLTSRGPPSVRSGRRARPRRSPVDARLRRASWSHVGRHCARTTPPSPAPPSSRRPGRAPPLRPGARASSRNSRR